MHDRILRNSTKHCHQMDPEGDQRISMVPFTRPTLDAAMVGQTEVPTRTEEQTG